MWRDRGNPDCTRGPSPSGDHKRKLEYDNRTCCGGDGEQCLRESYGKSFVHHVHSPWAEIDPTVNRLRHPAVRDKRDP